MKEQYRINPKGMKSTLLRRPVGASILYLNDFHHGRYLQDLNACAEHIPEAVREMAAKVESTPNVHANQVHVAIMQLKEWANQSVN
jgi:hypothetical protein